MIGAALGALLIAAGIGGLAYSSRRVRNAVALRRPVGPHGIITGAAEFALHRESAPGVLLLHGAGDTPQVMRELAEYLYARGFAVRVPLLEGHGRAITEFAAVAAERWHSQVQREFSSLQKVHPCVAIVGLSMGGALAIKLAADREDVAALVLLAPYVGMPRTLRGLASTSRVWGWMLPYFPSFGARSIRDQTAAARALGYGVFTPAALRALAHVVRDAAAALRRVKTPTLVIHSRGDNRIDAAMAARRFEDLGCVNKRLEWVERAAHVITVDFDRERVFDLTAEWLGVHCVGGRVTYPPP